MRGPGWRVGWEPFLPEQEPAEAGRVCSATRAQAIGRGVDQMNFDAMKGSAGIRPALSRPKPQGYQPVAKWVKRCIFNSVASKLELS